MRAHEDSISVVIVTWRRPDYVREALSHVAAEPVDEVIVVDASEDDETLRIVELFSDVIYVRYPGGAGHMTLARNIGLLSVTSALVAFIDDDAYVQDGWAEALRQTFRTPRTGAVAGRAVNYVEQLDEIPVEPGLVEELGSVRHDGTLVSNFDRPLTRCVEVSHGIGANMAFRSSVLAELGGLRDDFPGTAIREDTDIFLRVGAIGWRVLYEPKAVVLHVGAPHVEGQRFDWRYMFYARHNHALLLARNFGLGSRTFRAWCALQIRELLGLPMQRPAFRNAIRTVYGMASLISGLAVALGKAHWYPSEPRLATKLGSDVRSHLRHASLL